MKDLSKNDKFIKFLMLYLDINQLGCFNPFEDTIRIFLEGIFITHSLA
jgi:hypothetical protein